MLASIKDRTMVEWELIVADASTEPIDQTGFPSNVRVIPERPRLGMSRGYNVAFRQALGKWVIWLNDDCEVQTDYDRNAIRYMESNISRIGLGALTYRDPHSDWHTSTCCYGLHYANFGILEKKLGDEIGWFDETLPMYGADNAIAYRVMMAGKGVAPIPDARIYHHAPQDSERLSNQNTREQDAYTLKSKYGSYLHHFIAVQNSMMVRA